ncbi:protein kinase domain-containing protein [Roseisolibacter agri]|uniref:non-specific serine/threonine protein kinase n=1 Tax=Roseisolibacter agri TaxID=2014610 RepID=A0AA37Q7M5_9BACT|nr:protein kinase [Roseisolibacter agri]GLC23856.1 hypothetical protein rosag_03690 [Roseisolibacter agri]
MTPERWQAVEAVVQAALDRTPAERPAYVATACGDDAELRREVESLLGAAPPTGFLEHGAMVDAAAAEPAVDRARLDAALAGRYAIERELGRGGMATVYLARDLRHRRHVAVKVLLPDLAAALGAERFLREIEVTASLHHPHILPLFDSGAADGLLWYAMPYVDGETLRARLTREWQLPLDDALRIAREVADALAYAHARGVVHRDVKPENVLLQGGHAQVADFGIALAVAQATGGARMTRTGISIGTPQYMAPEQATGERTVDARADVYALGVLLYEMLAGEPPFTGPNVQAVIAKALRDRPAPPSRARDTVPPHVDAAVLAALERLPADRLPSATAFVAALSPSNAPAVRPRPTPGVTWRGAALLGGVALAMAALGWALGAARTRASGAAAAARAGAVRFTVDVDSGSFGTTGPAISPDGRTIVFRLEDATGARLYARRLDELRARPLAGTDDAREPFFSPDGVWVAFYANGMLRRVRLDGGPSVDVVKAAWFGGGAWGEDDTIWFADTPARAIYRASTRGGAPTRVPIADTALALADPHPLPGGGALLVTITRRTMGPRFGVLDVATGAVRELGAGFAPHYVAGHVVFGGVGGELYRQPFDVRRRTLDGPAEQLTGGLAFLMDGAPFDVSASGALVYRAGGSDETPGFLKLSVLDRQGRELQRVPARMPWAPRFSPDGARVAYGAFAADAAASDVWIAELATGATQRLTTDANNNNDPQWSPDGRTIAYSADAGDAKDVFTRSLAGGAARLLTRRPGYQFPGDWLRDGSAVVFIDVPVGGAGNGDQDLWIQPTDGSAARPYVTGPAREVGPRVSPDGRWAAYTSNESGRDEVYVQSFPTPGARTLVSVSGGMHPVWRADGRELYYWEGERLMAARVESAGGALLKVRDRTPLFHAFYPGGLLAMYDASPDGQRFIVVTGHQRANRLVVALDALR